MAQIPTQVVYGLVDNNSCIKAFVENPFNFQHYMLNSFKIMLDNKQYGSFMDDIGEDVSSRQDVCTSRNISSFSSQDVDLRSSLDVGPTTSQDVDLRLSKDLGPTTSQDVDLRSSLDVGPSLSRDLGSSRRDGSPSSRRDVGPPSSGKVGYSSRRDVSSSSMRDVDTGSNRDVGSSKRDECHSSRRDLTAPPRKFCPDLPSYLHLKNVPECTNIFEIQAFFFQRLHLDIQRNRIHIIGDTEKNVYISFIDQNEELLKAYQLKGSVFKGQQLELVLVGKKAYTTALASTSQSKVRDRDWWKDPPEFKPSKKQKVQNGAPEMSVLCSESLEKTPRQTKHFLQDRLVEPGGRQQENREDYDADWYRDDWNSIQGQGRSTSTNNRNENYRNASSSQREKNRDTYETKIRRVEATMGEGGLGSKKCTEAYNMQNVKRKRPRKKKIEKQKNVNTNLVTLGWNKTFDMRKQPMEVRNKQQDMRKQQMEEQNKQQQEGIKKCTNEPTDPGFLVLHNIGYNVSARYLRDFFVGHPIADEGLIMKTTEDGEVTAYVKMFWREDAIKFQGSGLLLGQEIKVELLSHEEFQEQTTMMAPTEDIMYPVPEDDDDDELKPMQPIRALWKTLSYLVLTELEENTSASKLWSVFDGAEGNSPGVIMIVNPKGHKELAYVSFKDKNVCLDSISRYLYASPSICFVEIESHLASLTPEWVIYLSTESGKDRMVTLEERYVIQESVRQRQAQEKLEEILNSKQSQHLKWQPTPEQRRMNQYWAKRAAQDRKMREEKSQKALLEVKIKSLQAQAVSAQQCLDQLMAENSNRTGSKLDEKAKKYKRIMIEKTTALQKQAASALRTAELAFAQLGGAPSPPPIPSPMNTVVTGQKQLNHIMSECVDIGDIQTAPVPVTPREIDPPVLVPVVDSVEQPEPIKPLTQKKALKKIKINFKSPKPNPTVREPTS